MPLFPEVGKAAKAFKEPSSTVVVLATAAVPEAQITLNLVVLSKLGPSRAEARTHRVPTAVHSLTPRTSRTNVTFDTDKPSPVVIGTSGPGLPQMNTRITVRVPAGPRFFNVHERGAPGGAYEGKENGDQCQQISNRFHVKIPCFSS